MSDELPNMEAIHKMIGKEEGEKRGKTEQRVFLLLNVIAYQTVELLGVYSNWKAAKDHMDYRMSTEPAWLQIGKLDIAEEIVADAFIAPNIVPNGLEKEEMW